MVDDNATRAAGEDRCEDRPARSVDYLPDGRGHGAARSVPENPGRDRRPASVAGGTLLSTPAHAGPTCLSAETCVRMPAYRPRISLAQRSTINRQGSSHFPGNFAVAK